MTTIYWCWITSRSRSKLFKGVMVCDNIRSSTLLNKVILWIKNPSKVIFPQNKESPCIFYIYILEAWCSIIFPQDGVHYDLDNAARHQIKTHKSLSGLVSQGSVLIINIRRCVSQGPCFSHLTKIHYIKLYGATDSNATCGQVNIHGEEVSGNCVWWNNIMMRLFQVSSRPGRLSFETAVQVRT